MKRIVLAGVDVSAKELVVALERGKEPVWTGTFANDEAGHRKLIRVLARRGATARVCVEATGIYHLELALALPPSPYDETWTLRLASAEKAELELKTGDDRLSLLPGDTVSLKGGRLHYERLAMWMGYDLRYDPTLPWLFSLAALAVVLMAVHFAQRLARPAQAEALAEGRRCRA